MDVARSHSKIVFVIFILIYRMLLDILYVQTIAPLDRKHLSGVIMALLMTQVTFVKSYRG